jgi:hypothetical protein
MIPRQTEHERRQALLTERRRLERVIKDLVEGMESAPNYRRMYESQLVRERARLAEVIRELGE